MSGPTAEASDDVRDKREARLVVGGVSVLALLVVVSIVFLVPALQSFVATTFTPGLGLKTAAVIAFGVSIAVLIVFAIVAGDGLIGEIQFMLAGFFSFFLMFWLPQLLPPLLL